MEGLQYGIQQGYNPFTPGAYGSQFTQQNPYQPSNPLAGLFTSGIGGLLGQGSARQQTPGQFTDGMAGPFQAYGAQPWGVDPITAAIQQAQQAQLAQQLQTLAILQAQQQQGGFGRPLPYGGSPYGPSPYSTIPQQIPQGIGSWGQFNRLDPITASYIQQAQQAQLAQLYQQLAQQSQLAQLANPLHHQWPQSQLQTPWANPSMGNPFARGFPAQPFQTSPLQASPFQTSPFQMGMAGGYV